MQITVRRAEDRLRGTFWHPVEHSFEQREVIEKFRRKSPSGEFPDKVRHGTTKVELEAVDLLLAGGKSDYVDARIEDPFKRGRFISGFVYVRPLAAFVYKSEVSKVEDIADQISPGVIISKAVKIEPGAQIGPYVELERGVQLRGGASVGAHSVVRKDAIVGEDAELGAHTYLAQASHVRNAAKIGSMSIIERHAQIGPRVDVGRQGRIGLAAHIRRRAWLDDSVGIGRHTYIGEDASIGEMTTIGDNSHIGDRSLIGAESRLGSLVRVARGVMLVSPTYAESGAFISESNFQFSLPEHPTE